MRLAITWPKSAGSTITLTPEAMEEHGLFAAARVFKVSKDRESSYKKVFTPFVTHCLAGDMLTTQAGGTTSFQPTLPGVDPSARTIWHKAARP